MIELIDYLRANGFKTFSGREARQLDSDHAGQRLVHDPEAL
jgi:hypothetical protein